MSGALVKLYVYDLTKGLARTMSMGVIGRQIDGIWHTSVVVFGHEYYFGQGILVSIPGTTHHGQPVEIIDMGETFIPEEVFIEYIDGLRETYRADTYHLLDKNCNNFTNDVCQFLTSRSIPAHITSLPVDFLNTPYGQSLRPLIESYFGPSQHAPMFRPDSLLPPAAASTLSAALSPLPTSVPIQTATNLHTLTQILKTQRAVVVFFTSATCGPCRAIEPEFENILQEASSGGKSEIVGVKVDTGVAFDAAKKYNITATPTFMFFLDDKKFHDFRGANRAELKNSVNLLIFTAYPPHPHRTILLRHIPDLSTAPILFAKAGPKSGSMSPIFDKLNAFVEQAGLSLSEDEKALLNRVHTGLDKNEKLQEDTVNGDQWNNLLLKFLNTLSPENQFPILDIFRLLLIREKSSLSDYYANKCDTIVHIIDQLNKIAEPPKSLTLMDLRIACNTFAFPSKPLFENPPRTSLTALFIKALLSPDTQIRQVAASLAFNISATIASQRRQSETSNVRPPIEDDDWEIEIASAVIAAIEREQDEETLHRLVGSLAHLIFLCPKSSEVPGLVIALGLEETLTDKQKVVKNAKVKGLCEEVRKIVQKSAEQ